jgi:hypothetical protein
MSSPLRTYIRELLREEGELQIRVLRQPMQLGRFSAGDVIKSSESRISDAIKGFSSLKNASTAFRTAKTGKVRAAFNTTKGSRKNVATALLGLGVVAAVVSQAVSDKYKDGTIPEEESAALTQKFAKFHNDILKIVRDRSDEDIESLRTKQIMTQPDDEISEEFAKTAYSSYTTNYNKYVADFTRISKLEGAYDGMYTKNNVLVETKRQIDTLIQETMSDNPDTYDREGLKYYASCIMHVHYAESIFSAIDLDCEVINNKLEETLDIRVKYNQFAKQKKAEMSAAGPSAAIDEANHAIGTIG